MKKKLIVYLFIGCGGMIGASLRYSLSLLINNNGFPFATLTTNLIGCFSLGYIFSSSYFKKLPTPLLLGLSTGVIASFTTLSAISLETIRLWEANPLIACFYVLISLILGLLFCLLGYKLHWRKNVME